MNFYKHYLTFYLLLVLLPCASCTANVDPSLKENYFSIMIVPDIQNYTYTEDRFKYLTSIADYYHSNEDSIDAIIQVGDLTNNNQLWQYENAYNQFFSKFDSTDQMMYCLGNHDYGSNGSSDIRLSNCPDYMTPIYDIRMEETSYENYVRYMTINGNKYAVLVLEFCTRNNVLDWANNVIQKDSNIPFIIVTHAFLNYYGQLFDYTNPNCAIGGSPKQYKMSGDYKNDSKEIFDKIIYNNPNVKLVICGHSLTPDYINAICIENVIGEKVGCLMVNFQHYTEGGEGIVGLLNIYNDHFVIQSFSTIKKTMGSINICF